MQAHRRFWLTLWFAVFVLIGRSAAAAETLARYSLTPGWATFGLALPQGASKSGVQVGTLPTQTDVKVRWPDGSIRFAIVSARIAADGDYPITASAAPTGAVAMRTPAATVTFTIGGKTYAAALPSKRNDIWLNGPLVSDSRAVVAPGDHPFLRVIFDVRSYAGGGDRVDVTVENCLDIDGADQVTYDVVVTIGDQRVFQRSKITHKYLARWRQTFLTNSLALSAVTPDLTPFNAAHAIPAFMETVAAPRRTVDGKGASGTGFDILAFGDLTVPMNAHSGRPELAPYPDWTAQYLVHKTAPARAHVLRHGELAGSWGVHVRNPDGTLPQIDQPGKGYYWLDPRWRDPGNMSGGFTGPRGHLENRAEQGDLAHQPSLAYVPYLLTGDRFFADETAFWANFCLIGSFASDGNRYGPQGLLVGNEVRGIGWGLRNLGDAAAYLPDGSSLKIYLTKMVWNNLVWLDKYATTFDSGPVQTLFPNRRPEDENGAYRPYMWISLWEQSYLAWAVDHVMQHGQVGSIDFGSAGSAIRNRIARLQLNLFTNAEWPKQHDRLAPYLLAAGKKADPSSRSVVYFQRFSEMASATFSVPNAARPDFVRPFEGYYGPEARLLLMICERLGDSGATRSLALLMADVQSGVRMVDDLNKRSGWAIAAAPKP
jgi:hypothetical protein